MRGKYKGNGIEMKLRVSENLRDSIKARARESNISGNDWMVQALTQANYLQIVDRKYDTESFDMSNIPEVNLPQKEKEKETDYPPWFMKIYNENPEFSDKIISAFLVVMYGGNEKEFQKMYEENLTLKLVE